MPKTEVLFGDPRLPARFWNKALVDDNTGCWTWTAGCNQTGYGHYGVGTNKSRRAHRVAYELLVGPIPEGLVIDHLCRNRACVNVAHMEPVTSKVNLLRGETKAAENVAKQSCDKGHAFDRSNTYITPNGRRQCRTCRADANRAYRVRKAVRSVA